MVFANTLQNHGFCIYTLALLWQNHTLSHMGMVLMGMGKG